MRTWETARHLASNIAEGEGGQSKVNMVRDRESNKPSSGFGTHKCFACGNVGHFALDKVCTAAASCIFGSSNSLVRNSNEETFSNN